MADPKLIKTPDMGEVQAWKKSCRFSNLKCLNLILCTKKALIEMNA